MLVGGGATLLALAPKVASYSLDVPSGLVVLDLAVPPRLTSSGRGATVGTETGSLDRTGP
jgi:hypothetical protein